MTTLIFNPTLDLIQQVMGPRCKSKRRFIVVRFVECCLLVSKD